MQMFTSLEFFINLRVDELLETMKDIEEVMGSAEKTTP